MSLDDILSSSGAGKGQFYHYFDSKEELGFALIERAWAAHSAALDASLTGTAGGPLERVFLYLDGVVRARRDGQWTDGCLFGALAMELCEAHPGFRKRLAPIFEAEIEMFAGQFAEAREWGWLPAQVDPEELARFLVAVLEGGLLLHRAEGGNDTFEAAVGGFKDYVTMLSSSS